MLKIDQTGQLLTFFFEGHFDTNLCMASEPEVIKAVENAHKLAGDSLIVQFDIEKVSYVASSFIRMCVRTAKELGSEHFKLINSSPFISKTFKIAGLDTLMG